MEGKGNVKKNWKRTLWIETQWLMKSEYSYKCTSSFEKKIYFRMLDPTKLTDVNSFIHHSFNSGKYHLF